MSFILERYFGIIDIKKCKLQLILFLIFNIYIKRSPIDFRIFFYQSLKYINRIIYIEQTFLDDIKKRMTTYHNP